MRRTYRFTNPSDMIALAQAVQIGVYWGYTFHYKDENIGYKDFWDIVEAEYENGAVEVTIDYDYVNFTHATN